jgi:polyisoprenyl-teichoic acid--peptidoglycan teichoic acid transferase
MTSCIVVVTCVLAAGGLAYTYSKVGDLGRVDLGTSLDTTTAAAGVPQNILVVGTDSAEGLDPNDPVVAGRPGGVRSDTIMVLRIDPSGDRASILSLPRDLYVPIDGLGGSDRINSAIQGGPQRLIRTISNDFGIPINHYVEINFLAFRKIVEAIDGVPIYFANPVKDDKSGLEIDQTGCVTLDPEQALAFARARAYEEQIDGRWQTDPTGDLGRIARQQEFIRKVIHRAIDKGARNPAVADDLVNAVAGAVVLDPTFTPADLLSLADKFAGFNPDALTTYSVPASDENVRGAAVLRLDSAGAEPIFEIFRDVQGAISPNAGTVLSVNNGNGAADGAAKAAADLRALGYTIPDQNIGEADTFDHDQTLIWYSPGQEDAANRLAGYLKGPAKVEVTKLPLFTSNMLLITGKDFAGVAAPDASTVPSSTVPGSTTTTTATTQPGAVSTTSTTLGFVPVTPTDQSC